MAITSTQYERTGVFSVDMVAAATEFHFNRGTGLKTIYLRRRLYQEFKRYFEQKAEKELPRIQFDGVDIEEGSPLSIHDIYFDYYEQIEIKN